LAVALVCLTIWHVGISWSRAVAPQSSVLPTPLEALKGTVELAERGDLWKFTLASLFRVTWAFLAAVLLGVPLGLVMGWFSRAYQAFNPLIQVLRPISPIAWIPLSIVWFGITEAAPIFLIFLASIFPIVVSSTAAVQNIQTVYLRAAR